MRVQNEPAWLLHHRPFQDASRILDVLSRNHGRLSLVARGSRSGRSRLKGLLRPFAPLQVSWVARSDLGTLTGADRLGAPVTLTGEALMAGYYVNELILHLVHRHDPQPELFAAYAEVIEGLEGSVRVPARLREFELDLLRLLGFALDLGQEAGTEAPLEPAGTYEYRIEHGPVPVRDRTGPMIFTGTELLAIRDRHLEDPAVLRAAGRLLREIIAFHLGGKELKSRKVLLDMQKIGK
jgi:DNA repair protein RecO (recombination protein O)